MSANGLDVFDRTLHTTNAWLKEISEDLEIDRHAAWKVLSVVLHKVRDRLTVDLSAHLGSQLPLLVRGVYYDQYQPARQPSRCNTLDEFLEEVGEWLTDATPIDPKRATASVFGVLSRHLAPGQVQKVRANLPKGLRAAWPEHAPPRPAKTPKRGEDAAAMATGI